MQLAYLYLVFFISNPMLFSHGQLSNFQTLLTLISTQQQVYISQYVQLNRFDNTLSVVALLLAMSNSIPYSILHVSKQFSCTFCEIVSTKISVFLGVAMQFLESQFYPNPIINFKFYRGIPIRNIIFSQSWRVYFILSPNFSFYPLIPSKNKFYPFIQKLQAIDIEFCIMMMQPLILWGWQIRQ